MRAAAGAALDLHFGAEALEALGDAGVERNAARSPVQVSFGTTRRKGHVSAQTATHRPAERDGRVPGFSGWPARACPEGRQTRVLL